MNLVASLTIAILFGVGAHLMRERDVVKLVVGTILVSNAAILLLVSVGFGTDVAPLLPVDAADRVSDPLVQALALTAVVIAFGTTVLLLRIALAVERRHDTIEMDQLVEAEVAEGEAEERGSSQADVPNEQTSEEEER